jgi:hypothetical protein
MDVVRKIGKVAKGPADRPREDVVMRSVRVEGGSASAGES